jgi:SAM-dependent methyltransferase
MHRMAVAQFAREYATVRRAEGWGSSDRAYYQALPFVDLTGRFERIWRIRARSYATFIIKVLQPLERVVSDEDCLVPLARPRSDDRTLRDEAAARGVDARQPETSNDHMSSTRAKEPRSGGRPETSNRRRDATLQENTVSPSGAIRRRLRILDLGAGNGWLSNRMALRGHSVTAIDLLVDPLDGLGAAKYYDAMFGALLAEFDHLPFADARVDLAVFNASFHYSTNYATTLSETLRVLQPHGTLVILDSPMYTDPTSGARMVQERQRRFMATYGFASDALPSEHFLTPARLDELGRELNLSWRTYQPVLDWRSALGRNLGGIRARREPAHFPVIVGSRQ